VLFRSEELIEASKTANNDRIVTLMKKIVPEFKSLNSVFETLDIEVKDLYTFKS
jgi:hypothetical protein